MRWVVIFEDLPVMTKVRLDYEAHHFAYLRENQAEILFAGGLRESPDSPFGGGLWILAPMPRECAIRLVEQDPYFVHSKRNYKLLQWGKALPEISVTL